MSGALPISGQIAHVRQRHYLVEQVVPGAGPQESPLVRMSCVDDDAQGQPLEVLWDRELDARVVTAETWEAMARRGFDEPRLFAAYLNTLRWNCVTATDARLFQSPFRAGIKLENYQLEPLRKALLLPRVNLFIADDVGLGKTIEAGLIARELLLRKKVREIVVCCPPSMLYQWQDELETRFGLVFEILDKNYVQRVRRERGFGVNPWDTHSRFLVSHRLLIDEGYTNPLLDWLGDFRAGSLLILDEAHHAAPASGQKYGIDSQLTRAVRDVAHRFEHRLFLSATPHNGHSNSFSALLEIMDPQRFLRGVPVTHKMLEPVMVRRLKEDLRTVQGGGFPFRNVVQVDIDGLPADAPELQLSSLLDEYRRLREERLAGQTRRQQAAAGLLITGLQQRLLSSVEAFARTLRVHCRTVQRQREAARAPALVSEAQLDLLQSPVGSDDDRADLPEEVLRQEEESQVEAATAATTVSEGQVFEPEQILLEQMTQVAEASRGLPDARVRKLLEWIRQHQCSGAALDGQQPAPGATWSDLRVLIFTEYDDTKRYLREQLAAAIVGTDRADERIAIYHGPTPPEEREAIKKAFNADPQKHPVRILIATDAAREGLNLQAHCWNLFHFDVPWNPSRLEQRNGRIDRKLQSHDVFCHYFVYLQRPEDRILRTLVQKTKRIKEELGSLAQVIDARLADSLKRGIRRDEIDALEQEIESADLEADRRATVEEELEATRERQDQLRAQLDQLRNYVDASRKAVGLEINQFRTTLSCALELVRSEPLRRLDGEDDKNPRYEFPPLDQREGAGAGWAATMDTLRTPRERSQRPWEWRRDSQIRPVVFNAPNTLDDSIVQLHLEHRVVQRLLGRFISQGFVHRDLSRACVIQTPDAIPRVVLIGRLCLYGPGASRLHEQLLHVTARWTEPELRKGKSLTPYARDAEAATLALLENSLAGRPAAPDKGQAACRKSAAADVRDLLPHLEERGNESAAVAEADLRKRGDKEARDMREILETQQKHIRDRIRKYEEEDQRQGRLFVDVEEEIRQLEADHRNWVRRLERLKDELVTEPDRARQIYDVKARRIEPVGLVYLWPETG